MPLDGSAQGERRTVRHRSASSQSRVVQRGIAPGKATKKRSVNVTDNKSNLSVHRPAAYAVGSAESRNAGAPLVYRHQLPSMLHVFACPSCVAASSEANSKIINVAREFGGGAAKSADIIPELLLSIDVAYNSPGDASGDAAKLSASTDYQADLVTSSMPEGQRSVRPARATSGGGGHPASSRALSLANVAPAVLPVMQLQQLLFPSSQSPKNLAAREQGAPQTAPSPRDHPQRRVRPSIKRPHLRILLKRKTRTFSLLMSAVRGDLTGSNVHAAECILILTYNILRNTPTSRQRKAARLCERLGLLKACAAVLRAFSHCPDGQFNEVGQRACCGRACEAASLLLTLCSLHNPKINVAVRLSRCLGFIFKASEVWGAEVSSSLEGFERLVSRGVVPSDEATSSVTSDEKGFTQALELWTGEALPRLRRFTHLLFSLFTFSKSPSNAYELGPRCAVLCAKVINAVAAATLPPELPYASAVASSLTKVLSDSAQAPAWLLAWVRRLDVILFWSLALLQRLCGCARTRAQCAEEANRLHTLPCLHALVSCCGYSARASGATECSSSLLSASCECLRPQRAGVVQAALAAFHAIYTADRVHGREEVRAMGGLSALVSSVLRLPVQTPEQWHALYLQMCSFYGLHRLPSSLDFAYEMGDRLSSLLHHRMNCGSAVLTAANPPPASNNQLCTPHPDSDCLPADAQATCNETMSPPPSAQSLLPVDINASLFSPELRAGTVEPSTALPPASADVLENRFLWNFTDAPPSVTLNDGSVSVQPSSEFRGVSGDQADSHADGALLSVSAEHRIRVLRAQIARLRLLGETRDDDEVSGARHSYDIVFERSFHAAEARGGLTSPQEDRPPQADELALRFYANFECGNLQRAIRVSEEEYDLVLSWDSATNSYIQWFCFAFTNYTPGKAYRFNIINMEKDGSSFNEGQRPLMLHGSPAGCRAWRRVGYDILYFQNAYARPARQHLFVKPDNVVLPEASAAAAEPADASTKRVKRKAEPAAQRRSQHAKSTTSSGKKAKRAEKKTASSSPSTYYTLTFSFVAPDDSDRGPVYLTNCFPYSYTELSQHIGRICASEAARSGAGGGPSPFMSQSLCVSPGGLPVPLITATALRSRATGRPFSTEEIRKRSVCFLSARVHPGEANSSWMMRGILNFLFASPKQRDPAEAARRSVVESLLESTVLKIVPMLNVDGVVVGNHRCSLFGMDVNRDYAKPTAALNPVVYSIKKLLHHITEHEQRRVVMYADLHGHSRAKNIFMYGCTEATLAAALRKKNPNKNKKAATGAARETPGFLSGVAPEKLFPLIVDAFSSSMGLRQCSFAVQQNKWSTGRVVMYKEFGIRMSYTVEASMMGGTAVGAQARAEDLACGPRPLSEACDGLQTARLAQVELPYTTQTYENFGASFLLALNCMLQADADVRPAAHCRPSPCAVPLVSLEHIWVLLKAAGTGGAPPLPPLETTLDTCDTDASEAALSQSPQRTAAGPYALATRTERRSVLSAPCAADAPSAEADSETLSLLIKNIVLRELLHGGQRTFNEEGAVDEGFDNSGSSGEDEDGESDNAGSAPETLPVDTEGSNQPPTAISAPSDAAVAAYVSSGAGNALDGELAGSGNSSSALSLSEDEADGSGDEPDDNELQSAVSDDSSSNIFTNEQEILSTLQFF